MQQLLRLFALFPQESQAQRVMALGEPLPLFIDQEIAVIPGGGGETQRPRQKNLVCR